MTPDDFIDAMRVPASVAPQEFGLWRLERHAVPPAYELGRVGYPDMTVLRRATAATLHNGGEVVMEDSRQELARHLPILLAARGRVLVSGLGLGCVLRGLLAVPEVERVDVVEIDADVLRVMGREFQNEPRAFLHHGDALTFAFGEGERFDFAWHDIHAFGDEHLQVLHAQLILRYRDQCPRQGAWMLPRQAKKMLRRHRYEVIG